MDNSTNSLNKEFTEVSMYLDERRSKDSPNVHFEEILNMSKDPALATSHHDAIVSHTGMQAHRGAFNHEQIQEICESLAHSMSSDVDLPHKWSSVRKLSQRSIESDFLRSKVDLALASRIKDMPRDKQLEAKTDLQNSMQCYKLSYYPQKIAQALSSQRQRSTSPSRT